MLGKNGGDDETRTRDLCRDSTQGLPNAAQVTQDVSNCGLDCGLGILRENCPERYLVRKVLGARSAPTTGT
jgi:hypothetical protein